MSRFYIKSIGASGPKVEYSQVTFDEGVNILHGPSNSGKSYVINCINFMFGASEVPFTRESTGYNTIHMTLESLDARTVQMTRRIIDDKNGKKSDMGDNLVTVVSNFDEVGSYDYSILKLEYSDMLLKLMGIDERHQIISTQIKREMSAVDAMSVVLNADAFNREMEKEGEKVVFHPMEHIDMNWWKKWSDTFEMIVKECNYPNCVSARISPDTYDAIVNGKHKSDEGKGYRAFLNSIILFSLMKALEDGGIYRPAMLILDSPILTLKEKVRKNELADPGMRASLFKYMVENCGDNQIIIAENEIPNTVDYNTAHLIEFTQDETQGIYGFLKSVRNSVDS